LGEFSSHWAIVYFEQFFVNCKSSPQFWATLSHSLGYALILAKNGLGYILGEFFSNSSGHPDPEGRVHIQKNLS
jgi:hypothetical protein